MAKLIIQSEGAPFEVLDIQPGVHSVGRSVENDFEICHPSISSRHCEIELCAEGLFVRDLGSTNGTFVDGALVVEETALKTGQIVRFGEVVCEVKDAAAAVAIPEWSEPQAPPLPNGADPCANHPGFPASMRCSHCKRLFCGNCVHILRRTKGMILKLCPVCSHPCQSIEGMNVTASNKGFLDFLKKTFRVPRLRK